MQELSLFLQALSHPPDINAEQNCRRQNRQRIKFAPGALPFFLANSRNQRYNGIPMAYACHEFGVTMVLLTGAS